MPMERPTTRRPSTQPGTKPSTPSIPAEAALSFLKDTKGMVTWSVRDLTGTLKISRHDAEKVVALLAAQGYVQREDNGEWMTTPSGESVSGAKPPRFTRESVEQAVQSLRERIREVNMDSKSAFKITDAVAFGDFLLKGHPRVQAADVGIGLVQRDAASGGFRSALSAKAERQFLSMLRGRSAMLHIRTYVAWMSKRSHLNLV